MKKVLLSLGIVCGFAAVLYGAAVLLIAEGKKEDNRKQTEDGPWEVSVRHLFDY